MTRRALPWVLLSVGLVAAPLGCASELTPLPDPGPVPAPDVVAPAPDPEPVVDGDITIAYENGLRILVKQNPGAELVAAHLYIRGGVRNWTAEDAGVEQLALRTATLGGTSKLDKDAFSQRLATLGSDIGSQTGNEYSVVMSKSLLSAFDETFGMMVDSFLAPAMPVAEIEVGRQQQLLAIRREKETPDGQLALLSLEAVYDGHPYENRPIGTEASVTGLAAEDLEAHLAKLRETSRLTVVVVGDVTAERVRGLVRTALAKLPRGAYQASRLSAPAFEGPRAEVTRAELPTTYVEASFVGPGWADPHFAAGILAMRVLANRVWEEVRTKRNLSYAPQAGFRWSGEITRGTLYVTAVDPNAAMRVMLDEVRRLRETPVPEADLAGAKAQFLTSHLMSNEATDGQASWLAMTDLVGGDYRLSRELPSRIRAVSAADVQAFARAWARQLQTVALGDPAKVDRALLESL